MLLRLHEDDRATYGGPEWLDTTAAEDALNDLDYDGLNALDVEVFTATGLGLIRMLGGRFATFKLDATRVRLWLAIRHTGVDIPLADFKPAHLLKLDIKVEPDGGDADPPSSSPGSSDTSTSATTPASETSGSSSTPGEPARTNSSRRRSAP